MSVVGGGGFPFRVESVRWGGFVKCISVGNVSFDFLYCVVESQRVRVSVGGAGGFSPRAERVGFRFEGVSRLGMFLS